ncbi:MAG: BamA/TamA family outer membrane protein [Bacteroidota bacterium]
MRLLSLVLLLLAPTVAWAQAPLFLVNEATTVQDIRFRFAEGQTFEDEALLEQIATAQPGFMETGWRRPVTQFLSILPVFKPPGTYPFLPFELQKDLLRLERYYRDNGFLEAEADWFVRLDTTDNDVRILFTVDEGPPLLIRSLDFLTEADSSALAPTLSPVARERWASFQRNVSVREGRRLDQFSLIQLQSETLEWLQNQGYAYPRVRATTDVDTTRNRADVRLFADVGPIGRFGAIEIEGATSVRDRVVARELPFRRGDRFSFRDLTEGQRQIFDLNLFQIALVDAPEPPSGQARDSTVRIRVRVTEGKPRLLRANLGYLTQSGGRAQAQWTHRNFLGDARTFTATATAETGFLALAGDGIVDRRYSAATTLRQPYIFDRRLSLTTGPSVTFRDDTRENSLGVGATAALLADLGSLRTLTLRTNVSTREIFGLGGGEARLSELLSPNALGRVTKSELGVDGLYGALDNLLDPAEGYLGRATVAAAGPTLLSNVQYFRATASVQGFMLLPGELRLRARASAGRLLPLGPTSFDNDAARLRDVVVLAGGTGDVRGYNLGLLGPKLPDFQRAVAGDGTTSYALLGGSQGRFFALGGSTKLAGSVEVAMPMPLFPPAFRAITFLDAGQLWTPGGTDTYNFSDDVVTDPNAPAFLGILDEVLADEERLRYSTGFGFGFASQIGEISLAVGYKLNPTALDVLAPDEVFDPLGTLGADADLDLNGDGTIDRADATEQLRTLLGQDIGFWDFQRFAFHLSIGRSF